MGPCFDVALFSKGEHRVIDHEKTKKYVYCFDEGYPSVEGSEKPQPPLWVEVEEEQADPTAEEEATAA